MPEAVGGRGVVSTSSETFGRQAVRLFWLDDDIEENNLLPTHSYGILGEILDKEEDKVLVNRILVVPFLLRHADDTANSRIVETEYEVYGKSIWCIC